MGLRHHYLPRIPSFSDKVEILQFFPPELVPLNLLTNDAVEAEKQRSVSKQIIVIQGALLPEPILCHFIRTQHIFSYLPINHVLFQSYVRLTCPNGTSCSNHTTQHQTCLWSSLQRSVAVCLLPGDYWIPVVTTINHLCYFIVPDWNKFVILSLNFKKITIRSGNTRSNLGLSVFWIRWAGRLASKVTEKFTSVRGREPNMVYFL
jgi:hypothetical protein